MSLTKKNRYLAMMSIAGYEGCRLTKYKDVKGYWTIGFGHLITDGEVFKKLTYDQADQLFEVDFNKHIKEAKTIPGYDKLCPARKIAIINIIYNMGASKFVKLFPSCNSALRRGDFKEAADQLLCGKTKDVKSQYYKDVGQRAIDVARLLESGLMSDIVINEVNYGPDGPRKSKSIFKTRLEELEKSTTTIKQPNLINVIMSQELFDVLVEHGLDIKKV